MPQTRTPIAPADVPDIRLPDEEELRRALRRNHEEQLALRALLRATLRAKYLLRPDGETARQTA